MPKKIKAELSDKTRNKVIKQIVEDKFPRSNYHIKGGHVTVSFKAEHSEIPAIELHFFIRNRRDQLILIKYQAKYEQEAERLAKILDADLKTRSAGEWKKTGVKFEIELQKKI